MVRVSTASQKLQKVSQVTVVQHILFVLLVFTSDVDMLVIVMIPLFLADCILGTIMISLGM